MRRPAETNLERQSRLAEIQRQIQAGTYETRDRLSAALDALLEDFAGQPDGASRISRLESGESEPPWPRPK